MKLTSEIIQNNLSTIDSLKKEFKILSDYENESDNERLKSLYNEGRNYGLLVHMTFIDYIRHTKKLGQQVFYNKKIKLREFKDVIVNNAIDPKVKSILKSKGKVSFERFLNSPRWDLYSGNKRRRGGLRYHDNFVASSSIIANFCIQNEIEIEDQLRISDWYRTRLPSVDPSVLKEIKLTNEVIDFMFDTLKKQNYDFRRINVDNLKTFIQSEIEKKMKEVDEGESVKLIDSLDFYSGLTPEKIYSVISKDISSGRLTVTIKNDFGFTRSYPYRIFETMTNLRNSTLDQLLNL